MAKYQAGPKFTTPRAPCIWPNLNVPDTKHNAAGVFDCKVELQLDDPIVQKIKAKATELAKAEYDRILEENPSYQTEEAYDAKVAELKAAKKDRLIEKLKVVRFVEPMLPEIDEEGEETGTVMLKAKRVASGTYKSGPKTGQKWTAKVNIFNAKGGLLANPPKIGGGSDVKMSIELKPYYVAGTGQVGCSFGLEAVQLITLVQFGQRDAAGYGFGAEDGDDIEDNENAGGFSDESGGASSDDDDEL